MPGMATGQSSRTPAAAGKGGALRGGTKILLRDPVGALSGLALGGFDLDAVLLGGGGDEAADAVGLPLGGLHDLGKRGAFGASDHLQDLRALALGARGAGPPGGGGGLGGLFARLRGLLRRGGLGVGALGSFPALGRALLPGSAFPRGGLLRRDVRAPFRNGGGCVGLFRTPVGFVSFSALALRMTIHRSGALETQGNLTRFRNSYPRGECMAILGPKPEGQEQDTRVRRPSG